MTRRAQGNVVIACAALTFLWAGLVLGISFVEAPLKFTAPDITVKLGVGIGQIVFTALNRIELALAALIVIGLFLARPKRACAFLYAALAAILLVQTFALLPPMDARVDRILNDLPIEPSPLHTTFVVLEVSKLILLLVAGSALLKTSLQPKADSAG